MAFLAPLAIPALGAAAGAGLGWIGSKIDDEGNSKYISKPIDFLTGDSVIGGAVGGALGGVAGKATGWAAGRFLGAPTSRLLGTYGGALGANVGGKLGARGLVSGGWAGGRGAGRVAGQRIGQSVGGIFRPAGFGAGLVGTAGAVAGINGDLPITNGISGNLNGYLGNLSALMGGSDYIPQHQFAPMELGWSPKSFNRKLPSSEIQDYADDLDGMLADATAAANLPLKQAVKNRRRDEERNIRAIQSMGRDTQRSLRKTIAQTDKAQKDYEKLAKATTEASANTAEDLSDRVQAASPRDMIGPDLAAEHHETVEHQAEATRDRERKDHRSFLDLMEDLSEGDTYGVQDRVNTQIMDSQDDVDKLRDQMAANAANINTQYRYDLANSNRDAAMNRYQLAYDRWNQNNYWGSQSAALQSENHNAAMNRLNNYLTTQLQMQGATSGDQPEVTIPISGRPAAAGWGLPYFGGEMKLTGDYNSLMNLKKSIDGGYGISG